jgi:glycerol kinase
MVVWGFEIGELLAAALRYRHLRFRRFCIKIIIKGIQKSEITDCDTGGCGMWVTADQTHYKNKSYNEV